LRQPLDFMQPILYPRCEINDANKGYIVIVTREPMLDLPKERFPTVKLRFENRRKEPNVPVLITPKRKHQGFALKFRQQAILALRYLLQFEGILDEVRELLPQGVHDFLSGGEFEHPSRATSAERVYELEHPWRTDDARVVGLGVYLLHSQLRKDVLADEDIHRHATCPSLDKFEVSDGLIQLDIN